MQPDGSFKTNMKYFSYDYGLTMTNGKFEKIFGVPRRIPEDKIEQAHKDLAASVQKVTSECMVRMAQYLHEESQLENLCLAGGVALNCVANGEILRNTAFKNLFIQPAASDAGGALGVASYIYHTLLGNPRNFVQTDAFLGPSFSQNEIEQYLKSQEAKYQVLTREELLKKTAALIEKQHVVGWFQGRMEFGPRALGARSILADARNPDNRDRVNLKIKFREGFRPFAPSVLEEKAARYFDLNCPSPFMLLVAQVRPESRTIPSVTHVDGSARIQTVTSAENPLYYDLIREFDRRTDCPLILNTSFNIRGEPIVCTPQDAYQCFMRTHMDDLVIGSCLLSKEEL
jgi:carbamoyltransferase